MEKNITAFKEHKTFKQKRPWDVNTLTFPSEMVVPPHYADTIEVLLCCNAEGEIYIGGHKFNLDGRQVFYIPPQIIHSIFYRKNNGYVKVLKINVEQLKPALNIEELLKYVNKDCFCLPTQIQCFDAVGKISDVFQISEDIFDICKSILCLFKLLLHYADNSNSTVIENNISNRNLRKIILWTEKNYLRKISLDEVSDVVGYEKHYFCNKFKTLTGISYVNYINNLRIQHACRLLKNGDTVSSVCEECGFDNLSYFIQLFKKNIGTTPKAYSTSHRFNK